MHERCCPRNSLNEFYGYWTKIFRLLGILLGFLSLSCGWYYQYFSL